MIRSLSDYRIDKRGYRVIRDFITTTNGNLISATLFHLVKRVLFPTSVWSVWTFNFIAPVEMRASQPDAALHDSSARLDHEILCLKLI